MEKETYEKVIEALVDKLRVAEWELRRAKQETEEMKKENERLRSEK